MKHCMFALFIFLSALAAVAQGGGKPSPAAFKKMQALAGDWEGKDADGMSAKTNFKVVVANTTVMETLEMHGEPEMLTLYTADGDGIALVHYCPTGNQPPMRAVPKSGEIKDWIFNSPGPAICPSPPLDTNSASFFASRMKITSLKNGPGEAREKIQ